MEGMRRNAERLLTLVNQVLDLARLDAGGFVAQPCAIDLATWAAETAEAFGPMGERSGVDIEWQATLSQPARLVDPDVLEKVVSNLLTNAIKFSPPGGRVRLHVEDTLGSPEPEVCIAVEDEGNGIEPEAVENLFSRFFQRDNTRGGVGLGLALVRELTEACGGSVQVRTAPGAGSSFTVRLPAPWAENGAAPRSQTGHQRAMARLDAFPPDGGEVLNGEERASRSPDGAHRILIVDDHADVRAFLVRVLAPHYRTEQADSGEAALALLRADPPDLVLTDIMMPGMDGHALLDAIRADAALRQVPVIVLTARADEEGRRAGLAAGVEDYLFKPFDPATLLARIENVLARRAELRDAHARTVRIEATEVMVTDAQAKFLARVRDAVEAQLADPGLSVDRLAEAVGTSRRSLERAVAMAGETPLQLIRRLRMEHAAQLLRGGHGTVKEVAGAVGYRHPGRFAADFRRVHGGNPSDFLRGTEIAD
jgi:DNA-binding response OmpR family regulator